MKIRFFEYGFFGKKIKLNNQNSIMISELENGILLTEGNEKLEIGDRLLKKAIINLKDFNTDIDIHVFSVASALRGKVVAIVAPFGTLLDVYNGNENK